MKGKIELLGGNYTVFLAKFELGNIVWKEVVSSQEDKQGRRVKDYSLSFPKS